MIQTSNVQKQFATRASTYDLSANWITDNKLIDAHLQLAGTPHGKGIELCCGTGVNGKAFTAEGWDMTGLDLTMEMLEEVNDIFPVVQGDITAIPFDDNSFDFALLRQALFLFDTLAGLKEIRRILKPGGTFVISQTVPFSHEDEPWLKHIHEVKQAQLLNFYNSRDIEKLLLEAGFNVVEMKLLPVRESITRWMRYAPEQTKEMQKKICDMVANAPEEYKKERNVEVVDGEVFEDWNWVIFKAE
jgi:ubiquinone/menaquinone biosynthesis C-methylase UbiE